MPSSSTEVVPLAELSGALTGSRAALRTNMLGEYSFRASPKDLHKSSSLKTMLPAGPRMMNRSQSQAAFKGPSNLGGNPGRVNSMEAAIIAAANVPLSVPSVTSGGRPRAMRTRNPITGEVPETPTPLAASASAGSLSAFGSRPMLFPERGTISGAPVRTSPSKGSRASKKASKLEYELWVEAQKRVQAERELKQVIIRGRSRPPWIGDSESSGYQDLYAQRR